jgi:hypothetical protein
MGVPTYRTTAAPVRTNCVRALSKANLQDGTKQTLVAEFPFQV